MKLPIQVLYKMWDELCPHKKMSQEKKTEGLKALRLLAEDIERKIQTLFLLLNTAQDRLEELMMEDEDEDEIGQSQSQEQSQEEVHDKEFDKKEWNLALNSQKKWDKISSLNI